MSITKYPVERGENPHPHLRLVSSKGDETPPVISSEYPSQPRSAAHEIFDDMIRGFALVGTAVHASPNFVRAQSEILEAHLESQPTRTGFLRRLVGWFIRSKAAANHTDEPPCTVTAVRQARNSETDE